MEIIFTFKTTRSAINGERHLEEAGVKVKAMALPSSLGAGCGLCLRLEEADYKAAFEMLKSEGCEPEGVYSRHLEDGCGVYRAVTDDAGS